MVDCEELDDLQAVLEEGSSNIPLENNNDNMIVKMKKLRRTRFYLK